LSQLQAPVETFRCHGFKQSSDRHIQSTDSNACIALHWLKTALNTVSLYNVIYMIIVQYKKSMKSTDVKKYQKESPYNPE